MAKPSSGLHVFLDQIFGWKEDVSRKYIATSTDLETIERLLSWQGHPEYMCNGVTLDRYGRQINALQRKRLELLLMPWALKYNMARNIAQASYLELRVIWEVNPFYCMYAFQTELRACAQILQENKTSVKQPITAYAIIWDYLIRDEDNFIPIQHAKTILESQGVLHSVNVDKLHEILPVPSVYLSMHPLAGLDPDLTPTTFMAAKVPKGFNVPATIRERTFMYNRLVREGEGYKLKTRSREFVHQLENIWKRAQHLSPHYKQLYQELKNQAKKEEGEKN